MFQRSSDGARSSGASHSASAMDKEGTARKRIAPLPLWGLSPKCSHAAGDSGQSSSSMAYANLSLVGHEAPGHGEGTKDTVVLGIARRANGESCHLTSEVFGGEDRDPL